MESLQTTIVAFSPFCIIAILFVVGLRLQRVRHKHVRKGLSNLGQRYFQTLESSTDSLWDWEIESNTLP